MKTIPLHRLVREPKAVKKWTRAGQTVQEEQRAQAIDKVLEEVLHAPPSKFSLSKTVLKARR